MSSYRSDISPVEELLLKRMEEEEGPEAAQEMYEKLTNGQSQEPILTVRTHTCYTFHCAVCNDSIFYDTIIHWGEDELQEAADVLDDSEWEIVAGKLYCGTHTQPRSEDDEEWERQDEERRITVEDLKNLIWLTTV